ncbi:MAG: hypothetical protein ACKO2Q_06500 [Actinomycetota bacterium]
MSRFTAFLWWCWAIFLLCVFAAFLLPLAIFIAPIALIAVIAFILW